MHTPVLTIQKAISYILITNFHLVFVCQFFCREVSQVAVRAKYPVIQGTIKSNDRTWSATEGWD